MKNLTLSEWVTVLLIVAYFIIAFYPMESIASDRHKRYQDVTVINNTYSHVIEKRAYTGIALGIAAAQHSFDMSTPALQWSIGAASYEDSDAVSFALAKKLKGESLMINGSYGFEDGREGFGFAINGVF